MRKIMMLSKEGKDALLSGLPYELKDKAKSIQGRRWEPNKKAWVFPLKKKTIKAIKQTFPAIQLDAELEELISDPPEPLPKEEPLEPMPIRVSPYQHQINAFNLGLKLNRAALLMEMGCGKSLTAVAIAGRKFIRGEVEKLLVVAPSSVVPVWPREFSDYAGFPYEVKALVGPVKKRAEVLRKWVDDPNILQVAVTNYESIRKLEDYIKGWAKKSPRKFMIICDESQRIKSPGAKQSEAMHRLGKIAIHKLILSGTPVTQGPLDFWSQYQFLNPDIFDSSFWEFKNRYAIMGGFEDKEVIDYQDLDELTAKAHSIAYRVTKKQALDLPETIDQTLYCELEPSARKMYEQLVEDNILELEQAETITAQNTLTKLLRLSQLCGGFITDEDKETVQLSKAKLNLLQETLDDVIGAGKKVVIFARFKAEIQAIREILEKKKLRYGLIDGSVAQKDRGKIVESFQQDSQIKVFVAQIQAAGLGITLTAADTAIYYSWDYSFSNYDQSRSRIHRIGQKNPCTYIHLAVKDSVDETILETLNSKKNLADVVVNDWKKFFSR